MPKSAACCSPGGVIVEGTAGNTGIGLALVGNARGYRTVIVIPETQSQEKKDMLRLCGAELRQVPAVPFTRPEQLRERRRAARRGDRASEPNGVDLGEPVRQHRQPRRPLRDTGPEIWRQTGWQGRRLYLRDRHRRHARRHGDVPQGAHRDVRIARDPMGAAHVPLVQARRAESGRQLDHRRHRPGTRHPQPRGRRRRRGLPDPGRRSAAGRLRSARARRACAWAARAASTSPARSGSRATLARATRS